MHTRMCVCFGCAGIPLLACAPLPALCCSACSGSFLAACKAYTHSHRPSDGAAIERVLRQPHPPPHGHLSMHTDSQTCSPQPHPHTLPTHPPTQSHLHGQTQKHRHGEGGIWCWCRTSGRISPVSPANSARNPCCLHQTRWTYVGRCVCWVGVGGGMECARQVALQKDPAACTRPEVRACVGECGGL